MDGKKLLRYFSGIASFAFVLFLVRIASAAAWDRRKGSRRSTLKAEERSPEEVIHLIRRVAEHKESSRQRMKALTQNLRLQPLSLEQVCQKVSEENQEAPKDPLERHGLSIIDFDTLQSRHGEVQQVREALAQLPGAPGSNETQPVLDVQLTSRQVVEVHAFMLQELEKLVPQLLSIRDKHSFDSKVTSAAVQAVLDAKVEDSYALTSEDIECAVAAHYSDLAIDQEFATIKLRMEQTIAGASANLVQEADT